MTEDTRDTIETIVTALVVIAAAIWLLSISG